MSNFEFDWITHDAHCPSCSFTSSFRNKSNVFEQVDHHFVKKHNKESFFCLIDVRHPRLFPCAFCIIYTCITHSGHRIRRCFTTVCENDDGCFLKDLEKSITHLDTLYAIPHSVPLSHPFFFLSRENKKTKKLLNAEREELESFSHRSKVQVLSLVANFFYMHSRVSSRL